MPTSELFQGILGRFEVFVVYILSVSSSVEMCFEMPASELFQGILGGGKGGGRGGGWERGGERSIGEGGGKGGGARGGGKGDRGFICLHVDCFKWFLICCLCLHLNCFKEYWAVLRFQLFT